MMKTTLDHAGPSIAGPSVPTRMWPAGSGVRSLNANPAFWLSMFAASALGTNLGDYWVGVLSLGWGASLLSLLAVSLVAIAADRAFAGRTEAGYWIAIVVLRAAATNVADFLTEDLALSMAATLAVLLILTGLAGRFTRGTPAMGGTPAVDAAYWTTMFIAGVFGTVAGDLASHSIGLFAASAWLTVILALMITARTRLRAGPVIVYWAVVLAERSAGTPVGDSLASHRGVGLGLPLAMACTGGMLLAALISRRFTTTAHSR